MSSLRVKALVFSFALLGSLALFVAHQARAGMGVQLNSEAQIYINDQDSEPLDGVIMLSSTAEPVIVLSSYQRKGDVSMKLYKASEHNLLNYLVYDDQGKKKESVAVADFPLVGEFAATLKGSTSSTAETRVSLPLSASETGIWYLTLSYGGRQIGDAFVIRSGFAALTLQSADEYIFWAQDLQTHQAKSGVTIETYRLKNSKEKRAEMTTSSKGLAKSDFDATVDVALARSGSDFALIPINMRDTHSWAKDYRYRFDGRVTRGTYFIFTDRPIYQPGDTVNFKAVVRDDRGGTYRLPKGPLTVQITKDWDSEKPLYEKTFIPSSEYGTLDGSYVLPKDLAGGYFQLIVKSPPSLTRYEYDQSSISFQVEHYRKPEYTMSLSTGVTRLIQKQEALLDIIGSYFSGGPATGLSVKYTARIGSYYDYSFIQDGANDQLPLYRAYGDEVHTGTTTLDSQGLATIRVPTDLSAKLKPSEYGYRPSTNQLMTVEVSMMDPSGNPVTRSQNFLLYAADYTLYQADGPTVFGVGDDAAFHLTVHKNLESTVPAPVTIEYEVKRQYWTKRETDDKYASYESHTEAVASGKKTVKPDDFADVAIGFTPRKYGSYTLTATLKDSSGRTYQREYWIWVSDKTISSDAFSAGESLTISPDKSRYTPQSTVELTYASPLGTGDILAIVGKRNVLDAQVIRLNQGVGVATFTAEESYLPEVQARAYSFDGRDVYVGTALVPFDTGSKRIDVDITTDAKTFAPGETIEMKLHTRTTTGEPVSAEVTVWGMDKALTELVESSQRSIFDAFWKKTSYYGGFGWWGDSFTIAHSFENINFWNQGGGGGGCFTGDTPVTLADGTTRPISEVRIGDMVRTFSSPGSGTIVSSRVMQTHAVSAEAYLLINGTLKVTPEHILWVDGHWQTAGSIQSGARLLGSDGRDVVVTSVELKRDEVTVYNLTTEHEHTYIAGGVYVHNQKGGGELRNSFKDVAYWNPRLKTDAQGEATVRFKLPDNLTTWVLQAVAVGQATTVGDISQEIIVTKPVIVRPHVPNILRVGDTVTLSATIHNQTDTEHTFDPTFTQSSLTVLTTPAPLKLAARTQGKVSWQLSAQQASAGAKMTFAAQATDDPDLGDGIEVALPVMAPEFTQKTSSFAIGARTLDLDIPSGFTPSSSHAKLQLTTDLVGSLESGIDYLIDYPYGCTEQTTSRLAALLLAKQYPKFFAQATKDKDIDAMITKGMERLAKLQTSGGWSFWSASGKVNPFVTLYVGRMVNLLVQDGYTTAPYISDYDLQKAVWSIQRNTSSTPDELAMAILYIQSVKKFTPLDEFAKISVQTLQERLRDQARVEGDLAYWLAGTDANYGSRVASTALALQALNGTDQRLAAQAVRYLMSQRKAVYWINTFGTSQSLAALLRWQDLEDKKTTPVTYSVSVDSKEVQSGTLTGTKAEVIQISPTVLKPNSKLTLAYGDDRLVYATFTADFVVPYTQVTDKNHGIAITKTITHLKDPSMTIGLGDEVDIALAVSSKGAGAQYVVIEDELPAGFIPVNEHLANESGSSRYSETSSVNREYTPYGVVLSASISGKYTVLHYRARAVSQGTYAVPPAFAQYMYTPEIYGRTVPAQIEIVTTGELPPQVKVERAIKDRYETVMKAARRILNQVLSVIKGFFSSPVGYISLAVGITLSVIYRKQIISTFTSLLKRRMRNHTPLPKHIHKG